MIDRKIKKTVKYVVECGMGHAPLHEFDNMSDAIECHRYESSIPSYIHPDKLRKSRVYKVTTTVHDITPE